MSPRHENQAGHEGKEDRIKRLEREHNERLSSRAAEIIIDTVQAHMRGLRNAGLTLDMPEQQQEWANRFGLMYGAAERLRLNIFRDAEAAISLRFRLGVIGATGLDREPQIIHISKKPYIFNGSESGIIRTNFERFADESRPIPVQFNDDNYKWIRDVMSIFVLDIAEHLEDGKLEGEIL